jgi:hypothetical protein
MIEAVMGGPFDCRLCGRNHNSSICHDEKDIPQLLKQQMELEDFENFISRQLLSRLQRAALMQTLAHLRAEMAIPGKKIYLMENPKENGLYRIMETGVLLKRLEEYEAHRQLRSVSSLAATQAAQAILTLLDTIPMTANQEANCVKHRIWLESI